MEPVQLTTFDGVRLDGELVMPANGSPPRAAVVVCHPHPQFGGNRFDRVVTAVFEAVPTVGCAVLRFDFRSEFGGGASEQLDLVAALDALDDVPALDELPRFVVGYSFGALVALSTVDERIAAITAIAPPLSDATPVPPPVPVVVICPRHDQFCPPDVVRERTHSWPEVDLVLVEAADHFLAGHTSTVAGAVIDRLPIG